MIISKQSILDNINNELSDNSTGEISPRDIRHNLVDIVESVHLLLDGSVINTSNFATPDTRNVKAGIESLESLKFDDYTSTDNTAIGYGSLRSSYQTKQNTAVGSYSLSCNVHGEDNVALGYSALGGNTTGYANIGLGNYSLNYNKTGTGNIAIGHGAGYYAGRDESHKFYLAYHPVDEDYLCSNREGTGLVPLLYGDLANNRIGVNTKGLHSDGVLQVSGNFTPSVDNVFTVGSNLHRWSQVNTTSVRFTDKAYMTYDPSDSNNIYIKGSVLPLEDELYDLGSNLKKWKTGFFRTLQADFTTFFQRLNYIHKTIYLASTGVFSIDGGGPDGIYDYFPSDNPPDVNATLNDTQLEGAGVVLKSTDGGDYNLTFKADASAPCAAATYKRWTTNIGIQLTGDDWLSSKSLVSPDSASCYGMFLEGEQLNFCDRSNYVNREALAGLGHINFIDSASNTTSDFIISFMAPSSGINVVQRFLSNTTPKTLTDSNPNLNGFTQTYHDDDLYDDRFCISSYNNSPYSSNHLMVMKKPNKGSVGINNFSNMGNSITPETILNVRSVADAHVRITAESAGDVSAAVQLLVADNCLDYGTELVHKSGVFSINMYKDEQKEEFIKTFDTKHISILNSGSVDQMVTIGDSNNPDASIGFHQLSNRPTTSGTYGSIFVEEKQAISQVHSVFFMDGSGNVFDLVKNPLSSDDGLVYSVNGNVVAGYGCNANRSLLVNAPNNTAIGWNSLNKITTASNNVSVGHESANSIVDGTNNISIGYKSLFNSNSDISNNIVIGCDSVGEGLENGYNLLIGNTANNILLKGKLGPTVNDKKLSLPNGYFSIENNDNSESLDIESRGITFKSSADQKSPSNSMHISFEANEDNELVLFNHAADKMNLIPNYFIPAPTRPYAELKGDLRLLGAIRFSDGSSLDGVNVLGKIPVLENKLDNFVVEGFALADIAVADSFNNPSQGYISDGSNQFLIKNRDRFSKISENDYVIAIKINNEYRPIWISNASSVCTCCTR